MNRRIAWRVFVGVLILFVLLLAYPVRTTIYRTGIVGCAGAMLVLLLLLFWRRRVWRATLIALPLLMVLIVLLPGREVDDLRLRGAYLRSLRSFESTRYVWGGETSGGVDCSGLLRTALVDASLSEGFGR